jgi:hypothetical protein
MEIDRFNHKVSNGDRRRHRRLDPKWDLVDLV